MLLFQPLILYSSACIGIDAGVITILITNTMLNTEESKNYTEAQQNSLALQSAVSFGLAYVSSILILGRMLDRFGMRFMCLFNTAIAVITFAGIIAYNEI